MTNAVSPLQLPSLGTSFGLSVPTRVSVWYSILATGWLFLSQQIGICLKYGNLLNRSGICFVLFVCLFSEVKRH